MKTIILSAGIGSRIAELSKDTHKSLLSITEDEYPLLLYTINTLNACGVKDISVIIGKHQQQVRAILKDTVKYYYNPFYFQTNSIASIWFAREEFNTNEDILVLNADTYAEHSIYEELIQSTEALQLLVDTSRKKQADMKVAYSKEGFITHYAKTIAVPIMAESVDLIKISKDYSLKYLEVLERMIANQEVNSYWEDVILQNLTIFPTKIFDIAGKLWGEIDTIADYEKIKTLVKQQINNINRRK